MSTAEFAGRPSDRGNGALPRPMLERLVIGVGVCVVLAVVVRIMLRSSEAGFDFRFAYWSAGQRVLHGQSPYAWSQYDFKSGLAFVYPALSALVFAPLSLLGRDLGAGFVTCLSIAMVPATLRVLE